MSVGSGRVAAIVVNWNTADLLARCLEHLERSSVAPDDVVVVDNGSSDDSVAILTGRWPRAQLIANPTNRGLSAGINQGLRLAQGEFVLLLDTDAFVAPDTLEGLLETLRCRRRAAVVGPRLEYADGRFQRWTGGRVPALASAVVSFSGLDRLWPTRGIWLGRDVRVPQRTEWVAGACMLVRQAAAEEVGGL